MALAFEAARPSAPIITAMSPAASRVIQRALVNGTPGVITLLNGELFSIGGVTVRGGRIEEIDFLADPQRLALLDLSVLGG